MRGFLQAASAGDVMVFAPELLPSVINYARTVPSPHGSRVEEGDRWKQALLLVDIASECFDQARSEIGSQARD